MTVRCGVIRNVSGPVQGRQDPPCPPRHFRDASDCGHESCAEAMLLDRASSRTAGMTNTRTFRYGSRLQLVNQNALAALMWSWVTVTVTGSEITLDFSPFGASA